MTTMGDLLSQRLTTELGDRDLAQRSVAGLDHKSLERLAARVAGGFSSSPLLSYRPAIVPADRVDSLWILAFGYRFTPGASAEAGHVPPMKDLLPGPINEALARCAARFLSRHDVPVIAQWEVARALDALGCDGVISVGPDNAADGSVVYLSTAGVIAKGMDLAAASGVVPGHVGILGHGDHVVRCVMAARAAGLTADVPAGVDLPMVYDPASGQPWTQSRASYIPVDLYARSFG